MLQTTNQPVNETKIEFTLTDSGKNILIVLAIIIIVAIIIGVIAYAFKRASKNKNNQN